ncbi:MAG TPA: hypothetical protein VHT75_15570 [Acidimicrobiales bacterium]|nr:hypothetical protein [Acidimicrobiales bacterium]
MERLLKGEPDNVYARLGEALVPPAPDWVDFNWSLEKVWRNGGVPPGSSDGDRFLVGDRNGRRAWAEVTEREGEVGLVLRGQVANPLRDISPHTYNEAVHLFGRRKLFSGAMVAVRHSTS